MQYRRSTVLAPEDPGTSGPLIVPIYLKELVSRFIIKFGITISTVSVMTAALADAISKIELVDGATILFSLSGPEAVAAAFYRTMQMPKESLSLTVGDIAYCEIPIYFGRYLWDNMLAFDPTRFVAPQLRITWNSTAPNAGVTVTTLAIYADVMDNPTTAPTGIIMSKSQNQYVMAASSHQYIDLPVDYALLKILVRGLSDNYSPSDLFSNFKFSYDQDAYIFLDQDAGQFLDSLEGVYPKDSQNVTLDDDVTADTLYIRATENQGIKIAYDATLFVTAQSHFAVPTFTGNKLAIAASVDIKKLTAQIFGSLPHGVIPFNFGVPSDPATWYKPQATTKFRADLLSSANAGATDTVYLATEQLRPY